MMIPGLMKTDVMEKINKCDYTHMLAKSNNQFPISKNKGSSREQQQNIWAWNPAQILLLVPVVLDLILVPFGVDTLRLISNNGYCLRFVHFSNTSI